MELQQYSVPLRIDESGTIRVGKTRVMLELVWDAYQRGATPEYIVKGMYPTLELADVYAAIAYCLRYSNEIKRYLQMQEEEGERIRREVEAKFPTAELKARLLARKAEMERAGLWMHTDAKVPGG